MENDDGYSDGNGTCRIEGCLKNICCRTGGGSNGMCRQGGAMCRAEHCTPAPAEPGVSVGSRAGRHEDELQPLLAGVIFLHVV